MKFSKGCTESRRTGEDTEFFWFAVSSGCSLMIFTVVMLFISFTEECFKSKKIEKEMARIAKRTDAERRAALGLPGVATDEQCAEEEHAKRRRDLGVDAKASDAVCNRADNSRGPGGPLGPLCTLLRTPETLSRPSITR